MSYFYTHAEEKKGTIYLRGYSNDKRFQEKIDYEPFLFIKDDSDTPVYRTLLGNVGLKKRKFRSIFQARQHTSIYRDAVGYELHGNDKFLYQFLNEEFPGSIDYDSDLIRVVSIDIETKAIGGWPNIELADQEITVITLTCRGKKICLGTKAYTPKAKNVQYILCQDERELLDNFLTVWQSEEWLPDVITGWNIELFDMPYLVRRIRQVLSYSDAKNLSPWRIIEDREVDFARGSKNVFEIVGINIIDYLPLYKKFALKKAESYALDFISRIELQEKKLDYREHGYTSLDDLWERNYEMYVDYNLHDAVLVEMLEDKLGFIRQVMTLAYSVKTNYLDVFGTVLPWDIVITNFLYNEWKTAVPMRRPSAGGDSIMGGYVKDPIPGRKWWVVSCDLTSLYPHLIMMFNISPETFVDQVGLPPVDQQLTGLPQHVVDRIYKDNLTIAGNGCMFTREKQGFLPYLMEKFFNDRKAAKNIMLEAKRDLQKVKKGSTEYKQLEKKIARYDNLQNALKILLNSAYGALTNEFYRFYDRELGEAITSSGQRTTMFTEMKMNQYLNKMIGTENVDYVVACDTDSVYITLLALVEKLGLQDAPKSEVVDLIDQICKDKIEPKLDIWYAQLAGMTNAYQQKMKMKREAIADTGIWKAKKRYILNVYDNEGVRFNEPEIKVTGIEAVRSSTPLIVRDKIKEAMKIALQQNEPALQVFIKQFREQFLEMPFQDVAFPRTCNGLHKYSSSADIYGSKCPPQVKGALLYNHFIKQRKLDSKYPLIQEGSKIRFAYLRIPNPFKDTVISCPDEIPEELDMDRFIDRTVQFDKAFLNPITSIIQTMGWNSERVVTLW